MSSLEDLSVPATLVIGLGNPLRGDDGIGVHVIQSLATQELSPSVELVDGGTQGLGIINLMEGRQRVILIDAANIGKNPGEFVRFTLDQVRLPNDTQHLSVHAAGLREALLLAQALKALPEQVIIFGVQPAKLDWESKLSPQVENVLPRLTAAVLTEIESNHQ